MLDTKQIAEQFNRIADAYDPNRRRFIPCFQGFYLDTTRFLASTRQTPPKRILDLGAGTGLLTAIWLEQFPEAQFTLVDVSEKMLDIARERFADVPSVHMEAMDYTQELPAGPYDLIISGLSIHHLSDPDKLGLFERIHGILAQAGMFANYDQFCAEDTRMTKWQNAYWETELANSGLDAADLAAWKERRRLDRECSVEFEKEMLVACGFESVTAVFSSLKFSVITAIRGMRRK